MRMMRTIYHTVGKIFDLAERENIAPQYAADQIAEKRIAAIGKLKLPLGRTAPRFMGHLRGER
jgi:leucine dehydrogenase